MNILLTGSGGFIGRHLKDYLSRFYNVLAPRSADLDLLNEQEVNAFFSANKVDFIIHSAAVGVRIRPDIAPSEIVQPNVQMFFHLAKHASASCPMIIFGSGAEYDKSRPISFVKEESFGSFIPSEPYGYSKYLISKEIEKASSIVNLRLFGVYGDGEDSSRVTTCIIRDYLEGRPISLNQDVVFHFIYIDDLCRIVAAFIKQFPCEKNINIVPSQAVSISELARIVNGFSDKKSEIVFKKSGLNNEYTGDNSLLVQLLNPSFTSYEEGMRRMYDIFRRKLNDTF